jgi:hypothetical protein
MKSKRILIGLVFILLFSTLLIKINFVNAQVVSDVNYSFNSNSIYDSNNPIYSQFSNIRNQTNPTNYYNSSYSFTDDTDYSDTPLNWIFTTGTGADGGVIPSLQLHDKVFEGNKTTSGAGHSLNLEQEFESAQTFGTVEFWIQHTDVDLNHANYIFLRNGVTSAVRINVQSDLWQYYDPVQKTIPNVKTPLEDTFQHVRIDFELTVGGYLGLNQYESIISVNGISSGALDLNSDEAQIDNLYFACSDWHTNYNFIIDSVGYSWLSNYTIGDNLLPYFILNSSVQEIDRWEFLHREDGTITENMDEAPFWDEINTAVRIAKSHPNSTDGSIAYWQIGSTTHEGIYNNIDEPFSYVREVVFRVGRESNTAQQDLYELYTIDSYDDTLMVRLLITDNGYSNGDLHLLYWDVDVGYIELLDVLDVWYYNTINISIINSLVYLNYNNTNYYQFPALTNKVGIGDVQVETYLGGVQAVQTNLFVDSIGVYINGSSYSDDFGVLLYGSGNSIYNPKTQNLAFINATGNYAMDVIGSAVVGWWDNSVNIYPFQYYNESQLHNTYYKSSTSLSNSYIAITTNNTNTLDIYDLYVKGININDGNLNYSALYDSGNVDSNVSYWYLDLNNYVNYFLNANDNNTEYIQITFDVPDLTMYNRSFLYTPNNFNVFGKELRINYGDSTTSIFEIPFGQLNQRVYLPLDKIFISLSILITDNDMYYNYNSTGYFFDFIMRSSESHLLNVSTSNLLSALTPLLFVILLPSLIITFSFKKVRVDDDLGGKVLLPIIATFTMVAFWFAEIELWMFFLMILGFGILFYIQSD